MWISTFFLIQSLFNHEFMIMGSSFLGSLTETLTDIGPSQAFARFMSLSSLSNDKIVNKETSFLFYKYKYISKII